MDISLETDTTYYNIKDTKRGTENHPQLGEHTPTNDDDFNLENSETADYLPLGDHTSNTYDSLDIGHQNGDQTQTKRDPNRSCYRKKRYLGSLIAAISLLLIGAIVAIFISIENKTVKVPSAVWFPWTSWSSCSLTCGDTKNRTRFCNNTLASNGSADCSGQSFQEQTCDDVDGCIQSLCGSYGSCVDEMNTYTCLCATVLTGTSCKSIVWSLWTSWSLCSLAFGNTKNRTRSGNATPASNGSTECSGQMFQEQTCNGPCVNASTYFMSSDRLSWNAARAACTNMSMDLVRIDGPDEQDFLVVIIGASTLEHWIGMTCLHKNCTWIDGTPANDTWTNWAPNEPKDTECVWIGHTGNRWDDFYCDYAKYYICENN